MTPANSRAVIKACVRSLELTGNAPVFIKLRSQCTPYAEQLVSAVEGSRPTFIFRSVRPWAVSRHVHFSESPLALAQMLRENLQMLERLQKAGHRPVVILYERLLAEPLSELARLVPTLDAGDETVKQAVAQACAADSQEGSSLRRDGSGQKAVSDDFLDALRKQWNAARPANLVEKYGLSELFRF